MFIQYLRKSCVIFILFSFTSIVSAEMYKWVDEDGNTHYSQQAPKNTKVDVIKPPPPPAIDPNVAQKEIDTLIEKQNGTYEAKQEERKIQAEKLAAKKKLEKNCKISRHNLRQYQNAAGRRVADAEGNITEPNEEHRLQKIAEIKQKLAKHCQDN